MELYYSKYYQVYVINLNNVFRLYVVVVGVGDIVSQIEMQQVIKFNGGGYINYLLFWKNFVFVESEEIKFEVVKELVVVVEKIWGSLDDFKNVFFSILLGI